MPTPFSSEDLGRAFESRILTRGRTLVLMGGVQISLDGGTIKAAVEDKTYHFTARITPSLVGRRVVFGSQCSCGSKSCAHLAAAAFAALDRFPSLRKPEQKSFFDRLAATPDGPASERQRLEIDLAPGAAPHACFISFSLVGELSGQSKPVSPRSVMSDPARSEDVRSLARLFGGDDTARTGVSARLAAQVLGRLARSGIARWQPTGRRLVTGTERSFDADTRPNLPPRSAVILTDTGPWYVDAASGATGPIKLRRVVAPGRPSVAGLTPAPGGPGHGRHRPRRAMPPPASAADRIIVERPLTPVLKLTRLQGPDEFGRLQPMDALTVEFDYGGAAVAADDERRFLRVQEAGGLAFIRRDPTAEAAFLSGLREDGFVQMRVPDRSSAKGLRALRLSRPGGRSMLGALRLRTHPGPGGYWLAEPHGRRFRPARGRAGGCLRRPYRRRSGGRVLSRIRHRNRRRAAAPAADPQPSAGTRRDGGGADRGRAGRHHPAGRAHRPAAGGADRAIARDHGRPDRDRAADGGRRAGAVRGRSADRD
jgi:hypothetical protein